VWVVFEAKNFSSERESAAERELVASTYQAFFYRALPPRPPDEHGGGLGLQLRLRPDVRRQSEPRPPANLEVAAKQGRGACWTGATFP
jgi:hypothetical protein